MHRSNFLGVLGATIFLNPIRIVGDVINGIGHTSINEIDRSIFEKQLLTTFVITNDKGFKFHAELVEVSNGFNNPTKESMKYYNDNFSLLFRSPIGTPIKQNIHTFSHSTIGTIDLFLSPTRWDNDGEYFDVVINKLVPEV